MRYTFAFFPTFDDILVGKVTICQGKEKLFPKTSHQALLRRGIIFCIFLHVFKVPVPNSQIQSLFQPI